MYEGKDNMEILKVENLVKQDGKGDTLVTEFDINHFQQRAEAKLNKILYTALDSMSKRFLSLLVGIRFFLYLRLNFHIYVLEIAFCWKFGLII